MFDDVGEKIKGLAKIFLIIAIIGSVIGGIILISSNWLLGLLVIGLGILVSWILCVFIYAVGQIVENTDSAAKSLRRIEELNAEMIAKEEPIKKADIYKRANKENRNDVKCKNETSEIYRCPNCLKIMDRNLIKCTFCGYKLNNAVVTLEEKETTVNKTEGNENIELSNTIKKDSIGKKNCPECGCVISIDATECPTCGNNISK